MILEKNPNRAQIFGLRPFDFATLKQHTAQITENTTRVTIVLFLLCLDLVAAQSKRLAKRN